MTRVCRHRPMPGGGDSLILALWGLELIRYFRTQINGIGSSNVIIVVTDGSWTSRRMRHLKHTSLTRRPRYMRVVSAIRLLMTLTGVMVSGWRDFHHVIGMAIGSLR